MPSRRLCHGAITYIVPVLSLFSFVPPAVSRERHQSSEYRIEVYGGRAIAVGGAVADAIRERFCFVDVDDD